MKMGSLISGGSGTRLMTNIDEDTGVDENGSKHGTKNPKVMKP